MKHLKPYHLFEGISYNTLPSFEYKEDFETLRDILSELKIDYFNIDYLTFDKESHHTFSAMIDSIRKWEKTKTFKKYVSPTKKTLFLLRQLIDKEIEQVIIVRIERDKFYWNDVEETIKESIHHMIHNGWRYIIEPVWKGTSMGYHLEEMKYFDNQELDLLSIRFYC